LIYPNLLFALLMLPCWFTFIFIRCLRYEWSEH